MNKNEIKYRIGENKVEFAQTSKGFWYCTGICINCYSVIDGVVLMEHAIENTEKLLSKINSRLEKEESSSNSPRFDIDIIATKTKKTN
jgi:hypothetical protein